MAYTQNPEFVYDHSNSIREDVIDRVSIMSPVTAPLTYQLGFGEPLTQPVFSWLLDYVTGPVASVANQSGSTAFGGAVARRSAYPEGWEASFPAEQKRTDVINTTCIVERTVDVSASLRASLQYGVGDEYGYKTDKMFLEVVEQFDFNLHFGEYAAGSAGSAASTARMTQGVAKWIFDTGVTATPGAAPATTSVTVAGASIPRSGPTDRTGYSSTWWEVKSAYPWGRDNFHAYALEPAYKRGMEIDGAIAFCGAAQKRKVSEFATVYNGSTPVYGLNERNVGARERFISEGLDAFDTNMGTVYFNLDRHLDSTTTHTYTTNNSADGSHTLDPSDFMMILDPRFWRIRIFRGIGYTPLAKVGDGDKALIVLEGGLEASNPIGGIGIAEITAA